MINLGVIKSLSHVKKFLRGTIITEEGRDTGMYIVLKGEVGIVVNDQKQNINMVDTVGPGGYFGETTLFSGKSPSFTAIALNDVIVLPMDRNNAAALIADEPELAFELMTEMSARLERASKAYESLSGHPWTEPKPSVEEPLSTGPASANKARPAAAAPAPKTPAATAAPASPATPKPAARNAAPASDPLPTAGDHPHSERFSLFPEWHGTCQLPLDNTDPSYLMEKSYVCPICKKSFKTHKIIPSKLVVSTTDKDMRNRYSGIEPLYYDIATCPNCLYSADSKMFDKVDRPVSGLISELSAFKSEIGTAFSAKKDTFSIFAGYYLALFCAPKCFAKHQIETAKLLLKLSRVYQDTEDASMEAKACKQALDAYMFVYENVEVEPSQEQQLCIIMGELSMKLGDIKSARNFFYKAKTDPNGTPVLKRQADNRITDIRDSEQ